MNWWTLTIYGAAAVVAVQILFALMTAHRQAALRRFCEEHEPPKSEPAASQHPQ